MGEVVSAGGIILSDPNLFHIKPSLLVVNRPEGHGLPKGRVKPGETDASAALREVLEETGIEAEITGFAGEVEYEANNYDDDTDKLLGRVAKRVVLFYMDALRQAADPEPGSQPLWVPQDEAIAGMHHVEVADFLKGVLGLEDIVALEHAIPYDRQHGSSDQQHYGIPAWKAAA